MKGRLLFVDDEEMKRRALRLEAEKLGYEAEEASNAFEGLERLRSTWFDVVVTDVRMPRMDGLEFLRRIRSSYPQTTVVIMTAYGTVANAVQAMKEGAHDYLLKPFTAEELFLRVDRIMQYREAVELNRAFLGSEDGEGAFQRMIGRSRGMQGVFRAIARAARTPATVLIAGESGTGKELVAEALHALSGRASGPLVAVSCAALARDVLESELFGHVKGAFTGAVRDHRGRFEAADGGTLYLDEVDDVPLDFQVKLLRALQNREVQRVGGDELLRVDVRVIASTKAELEDLVARGRFREDLYYRLNVVRIHLPPLRERREDVPVLAEHFLRRVQSAEDSRVSGFDPDALQALQGHDWPGNVRELENAVERAVAFATTDRITLADLPDRFHRAPASPETVSLHLEGRAAVNLPRVLAEAERRLLQWALEGAGGNQVQAALHLGIPRSTLRDRLARAGLDADGGDGSPQSPDGDPSAP